MSSGAIPTVFLLVIVPVLGAMLAWVVWSVLKITQPLSITLNEWDLISLQLEEGVEMESSLIGAKYIQKHQRSRSGSFGENYSYKAGENLGYGIPVSWIQNLGDRKN